jgi:hypothetical protein
MKSCTAKQLVTIQSLRTQLGLKPLDSYQVKCLSINSASVMIDDLSLLLNTLKSMKEVM